MNFTDHHLNIEGINIHHTQVGQGPPLILIHGYLVNQHCWATIADLLAPHFSIFALDLPGFGTSDCPSDYPYNIQTFAHTVVAWLNVLGLKQIAAMGHSMGSAVALAVAVQAPEKVQRLVLADPVVYPIRLPLEGRLALLPFVGNIIFNKLYRKADMRRYFSREVYSSNSDLPKEEDIQRYWDCLNRPGGRLAAYHTLHTISSLQEMNNLPGQVRCPVQIVWGERDRLVPYTNIQRLARALNNAVIRSIPECGHAPIEERPELFCQAILPFLQNQ